MIADDIQTRLSLRPFKPLRLELANGETLDVLLPGCAYLSDSQLVVKDRASGNGSRENAVQLIDVMSIRNVIDIKPVDRPTTRPMRSSQATVEMPVSIGDWFESILALTNVVLICVLVGAFALREFVTTGRGDFGRDYLAFIGCVVALAIEVIVLGQILRFYGKRLYPLPLVYALQHEPSRYPALRPLVFLFWAMHAVIGVAAFAWLHMLFSATSRSGFDLDRIVEMILPLFFVSAGAHASVMFILLSIRSLGVGEYAIEQLWKWRFAVDMAIIFVVECIVLPFAGFFR